MNESVRHSKAFTPPGYLKFARRVMSAGSDTIDILHVDDDREFAELTAEYLATEDDRFSIQIEHRADQAQEILASSEVDCVISDYEMPTQTGLELLETVRDSDPDLPFILFTGKGSEEVASDAISAGVTDYLQKTGGSEQFTVLANRIRNAVDRARAEAERDRHFNAIETAREGISILDTDGRFVYVNRAYADLYGYEPEEIIGQGWELLYREKDYETVRKEILPTVEETGYWRGETIGLRADGETFKEDHALSLTDTGELVCTVRDMTPQIERQRELEEANARLEALFENSPDMINTHDEAGLIQDVNERFCEELGYDEEEIIGEGVWTIDRFVEPAELRSDIAGLETGDRLRVESEYERADGSAVPVEVHIVRLDLDAGDRFMVISRDISERTEQEHELERLMERYQAFIEHASDMISVVDASGRIRYSSPATRDILGYAQSDLTGEIAFEYMHPDDRERVRTTFEEMVDEPGTVTEQVQYRFKSADGEWTWIETVGSNKTESAIDGYVLTTREISRRKEHERRLEALNETTHDLLTADSREEIAAIGVEAARDIIGLEANVCNLYVPDRDALVPSSYTDEVVDLIGTSPPTLTSGDSIGWRAFVEQSPQAIDDIQKDPDVYNPETAIRSELYLPLDDHGILIAGSPEVGAFDQEDLVLGKLLARGITVALDTFEQTEELREREAELSRQNDRLEQFASFVSHDLQNPLTVAKGRLELAREDCDSDHLDSVARAHDRMETLIDDLLTLTRETDRELAVETVSLDELSEACWRRIDAPAATLITENLRPIQADASQLRQLLVNLFRNAVNHGGSDVTVTIGSLTNGFYIEDDGEGLPADTTADIFEAGYSTADEGTGIGLAIVKQIVQAHDWEITVINGSQGGARFEITDVDTGE